MCSAPILIPNPYFNRGTDFQHNGKKVRISIGGKFDYLHDTISHYVQVPCGKCSQCISNRQSFLNQRIQMESLRSELFYFTLTYANRGLKRTNILDYHVPYPYYFDIQALFKRLRKILPHKIRTFVVSEYGSEKHRPHFHGFIAVSKEDIKTYYRGSRLYCEKVLFKEVFVNWKRNISKSHKHPIYMALSDFVVKGRKHTYELHWVAPIRGHDNDLSFYLSKYILKPDKRTEKLLEKISLDIRLSDSDRKDLTSMIKPRAVISKDFGSYKLPEVSKYIKSCLSKDSNYPLFFDINTGKSTLLAPYYRKRFVTLDMKFNKWWDYLHEVQYLDINAGCDSFNPELLVEDFITDLNRQAMKSIQNEKHLKRVKNLLSKK